MSQASVLFLFSCVTTRRFGVSILSTSHLFFPPIQRCSRWLGYRFNHFFFLIEIIWQPSTLIVFFRKVQSIKPKCPSILRVQCDFGKLMSHWEGSGCLRCWQRAWTWESVKLHRYEFTSVTDLLNDLEQFLKLCLWAFSTIKNAITIYLALEL